jgi:ATP-dependent Clp protease ATP-binding subunit ClpB
MPAIRELDITKKSSKANALAAKFADRIVGQDDARDALISVLDKFTSGMYNKTKPIASLLYLGPTGTGKTLTAESFVEGLYGFPTNMLKVDCAEFQHSHEIAKLVGSPPGYLGHRETHPYFTNMSLLNARMVGEKEMMPFSVVLFDEIEKASDSLWNLLLGILDKGTLTTGTNEKVDFTKTIIIMTSNVGSSEIANENALGFSSGEAVHDDQKIADIASAAARRKFMPEFLNRLDYIVNFKTLTKTDLSSILKFELEKIQNRIMLDANVIFEIRVSDSAMAQLLEDGYEKRYNARHLVRAVDKHIASPLTRLISTYQVHENDVVVITYDQENAKWRYVATHP